LKARTAADQKNFVGAAVYQKLHEFNLHIEQGVAALREMAQLKALSAAEIRRMADYFEEIRSSTNGYLASVFSDQELRESGRLFSKRHRREMAEDPMHGGWLEEERAKKQEKELRKARKTRNRREAKHAT
jgi:hypothetical protein